MKTLDQIREDAQTLDELLWTFSAEDNKAVLEEMDEAKRQAITAHYLWHRCILHGDFKFFIVSVCGIAEYPNYGTPEGPEGLDFNRAESPHNGMVDFLFDPARASDGRIYKHLEAPRTSYKSRLLQAYVLWRICQNPQLTVLWSSETELNVKTGSVRWLKNQFDNNERLRLMLSGDIRYAKYGGDWKNYGSWNDSGFVLRPAGAVTRENTVSSGSVRSSTTGRHFDLIVCDDLVSINTVSDVGIDTTGKYFDELLSQLAGGGEMIVVGTRYHRSDIYSDILEMEEPGQDEVPLFNTLIIDAYDRDGRTMFSHLTEQRLTVLKNMMYKRTGSNATFMAQYRNTIISDSMGIFKDKHFVQVKIDPEKQHKMARYIVTDFAESKKKTADRTVLYVIGMDWERMCHVLHVEGGRWDSAEIARRVYELRDKYDPLFVTVEAVVGHERIITILNNEGTTTVKGRLQCTPVPGRSATTKSHRIQALHWRFESRKIVFNEDIDLKYMRRGPDGSWKGEMVEEFLDWNPISALHDDYPDALSDIDKETKGLRLCAYPPKPPEDKMFEQLRKEYCIHPTGSLEEAKWIKERQREQKDSEKVTSWKQWFDWDLGNWN